MVISTKVFFPTTLKSVFYIKKSEKYLQFIIKNPLNFRFDTEITFDKKFVLNCGARGSNIKSSISLPHRKFVFVWGSSENKNTLKKNKK